jgi:2-polyprenyl-3-methyl-5-hydroxy-6-metoxy-1,4-benzoquinol methylase
MELSLVLDKINSKDFTFMDSKFKHLYTDDYFDDRFGNNPLRVASFKLESEFIYKYVKSGKLMDVGCATGEFSKIIKWPGDTCGIEISDTAIEIAKSNGVSFSHDLTDVINYYDVIIFRGTIQHFENPFNMIKSAFESLKPGGYVFFLATPNADSIYYKLWGTLPSLDPKMNFWIPGSNELINVLKNFGFNHIESRYPYLDSPYSKPIMDHIKFLVKLFLPSKKIQFPFWKSVTEHCFIKPL